MGARGLPIRDDIAPDALRRLARWEPDRAAAGRMFAIANALEGMSRADVSTKAMSLFLDQFSRQLAADEHAVMVLDQAGWHGANALRVPDNVTLVPLPSYSPELNPVERLWLYLRERHLSHRLLDDYDAIVEACCRAWNQLTPARINSLCNYPYIQQVSL